MHRRVVLAPVWVAVLCFGSYTLFFRGFFENAYKTAVPLPGLDPLLHAFWGLQYYLLGIVLLRWRSVVTSYALAIAGSAFALMVALKLSGSSSGFLLQYSFLIFGFCLFVAIGESENVLSKIGAHTMGIYLFHSPVLLAIMLVLCRAVSDDPRALFAITWVGTFLSAWGLAKVAQSTPLGQFMLGDVPVRRSSG